MNRTLSMVLMLQLAAGAAFAQSTSGQNPAPAASAPTQPQYPIVTVGILSYLQYDAELENQNDYNAFDVTRGYINVNGQLSPRVGFRFTPDIKRLDSTSLGGSLAFRVKYAYMQVDNVLTPHSWLRFGAHQTPWLDFEEGINRYRVQGQMMAERDGFIPGSSDLGVSYFVSLPGRYGEIHGGVFNGEGYAQPEANKYKSAQVRVTVRPLPNHGLLDGFRVSGFFNEGWYAANRPRRLGIVMASYEQTHVAATLEYLKATENPSALAPRDIDRRAWSAYVEPRQGSLGWAGILRYDSVDPDRAIGDNSHGRVIAGGAYWFLWSKARLGLVVTNEQVHYDALAAHPTENRVLVQTHVQF